MRITDLYPSKWLRACDIPEGEREVTILSVTTEAVGRDQQQVPIVEFRGVFKRLILNKTNSHKIAEILGTDETDHWRGRQVVLLATTSDFGDGPKPCIRIKAAANGASAPSRRDELDDIPF